MDIEHAPYSAKQAQAATGGVAGGESSCVAGDSGALRLGVFARGAAGEAEITLVFCHTSFLRFGVGWVHFGVGGLERALELGDGSEQSRVYASMKAACSSASSQSGTMS